MFNRVTNKMIYVSLNRNIMNNTARLQEIQEQASSNKRINRPSDDPLGEVKVLDYRTILSNVDRYLGNITMGTSWLNLIDSTLSDMGNLVSRAKSLAISQAADTADATTRKGTAVEIESLYNRIIDLANTQMGESYLFGGTITDRAPLDREGVYYGNADKVSVEIAKGVTTEINTAASGFLVTDLNPSISLDPSTAGYTFSSQDVNSNFFIDSSNDTLEIMLGGDTEGAREIQLNDGLYTGAELAEHLQETIRRIGIGGGVDYGQVTVTYDDTTNHFVFDSGSAATFDTIQDVSGGHALETLGFSSDITGNGDSDVESDTAVAFNIISGANDTFDISVDGGATHTITLTAGTYTAASLTLEMQSQLDTALGAGVVTVDYDTVHPNRFTLTSSTTGASSSVTLQAGGNDFLRMAELEPDLSVNGTEATHVSDLNLGEGVTLGVIRITDRAGNSANIDLTGAVTVKDVLDTINATAGVNVTASLDSAGNALVITDTNASPAQRQNLAIEDITGTAAQDLGISQDVPSNITGKDLNPAVTSRTRISSLYGGEGLTLGYIDVENNGVEGSIDLSESASIVDILNRINSDSNADLNISASIMASKKGLDVRSTRADTVALVFDGDSNKSSSKLGIQGEQDILKTIKLLKEALEVNDGHAIGGLLQHLDEGSNKIHVEHASIGSSAQVMKKSETIQKDLKVSTTKALSNTEDADIFKTLSDFSLQQLALQVSLESAARLIQPTLLDFLR